MEKYSALFTTEKFTSLEKMFYYLFYLLLIYFGTIVIADVFFYQLLNFTFEVNHFAINRYLFYALLLPLGATALLYERSLRKKYQLTSEYSAKHSKRLKLMCIPVVLLGLVSGVFIKLVS